MSFGTIQQTIPITYTNLQRNDTVKYLSRENKSAAKSAVKKCGEFNISAYCVSILDFVN
jgi:hypothetical protein